MSYGEVDAIDLVAFPLFLIGGLTQLGLMTAPEVMGIGLSDTLLDLGAETSLTIATAVALAAIAIVITTNKPNLRRGRGYIQFWVVAATVGLVIAPPFVPILENLLNGGIASGVALLLQSAGYMIVSWLG